MDAMQKGIIKAMVDAKRYIFYFDVVNELTREQFQETFETNDFDSSVRLNYHPKGWNLARTYKI